MWNLMIKDVEQNARALTFFALSAMLTPAVFHLLVARGGDSSFYVGVVFGLLVFSAPMLLAFWLIGQEKVKGTFRFLAVLPVSGTRVIAAKALTSMGLCLALVNFVLILEPLLLRAAGARLATPATLTIIWVNLTVVLFAAICVALFTALNQKIATQVWYLASFGLYLGATLAGKYAARAGGVDLNTLASEAVARWSLQYWGALPVLALATIAVLFAGRVFARTEWSELEES